MTRYFGNKDLNSPLALEAYASDASIYSIRPALVVCPTNEKEAIDAVARAVSQGWSITPRGGGTGLAGGALGSGLLIDCSRLNETSDYDADKKTITCQPGIIYQDLNRSLAGQASGNEVLHFPPDPSSGDSCQIGGMIANNSSGPRSVKYGLTSAYVEQLRIVNGKAAVVHLKKLTIDSDEFDSFLAAYPEYDEILQLLRKNRDLIKEKWPTVKKNSAGYNLLQVIDDLDRGIYNLPALYVGSEGTLGLFLSVKLRLLKVPREQRSFRLFFGSLEDAGKAVKGILDTGPSVLEIIDGSTLTLIGRGKHSIPPQAEAMLLVEYDDDADQRSLRLQQMVGRIKLVGPPEEAVGSEEIQALWAARRAIVPILYRHHETRRPLPVIEDASLPVENLPRFIGWIRKLLEEHGLVFGMFGHIGDGNLHIRPILDLNSDDDFQLMRSLYTKVYDKIFELGGSSTAEHADGRLRAPVVKQLYGEDIYKLFLRIKNILDPGGTFNPGVILSETAFTENIDKKKLELLCAACGKCNGYCPAFEIFRREDMSPRGWLRMLHQGDDSNGRKGDYFRFCLNCKNCVTVCPAGVDIAGELLAYNATRPGKIAGGIIALSDRQNLFSGILRLGSVFYPVTKTVLGRKLTRILGGKAFGYDEKTVLPRPTGRSLRARHADNCTTAGTIAFFHGCADNLFATAAGDAALSVFKHFGLNLVLPPQKCCGLPMEIYGHRSNMIKKAKYNLDSLGKFEAVVFTCASCLHKLADYEQLFDPDSPYHQKAQNLKQKSYDISQYLLLQDFNIPQLPESDNKNISYHHPCHLRAAGLEKEPIKLLEKLARGRVIHPDLAGRCCGQAGSFGYLHHREGRAIFQPKKEEYQSLGVDVICSSCPSCIMKIKSEMGDGVRVCHPVELLSEAIGWGSRK